MAHTDTTPVLRSETRDKEIIENAPIGIVETTLSGTIIRANPAFATLFGYESVHEMTEVVSQDSITHAIYQHPSERERIVEEVGRNDGAWRTFTANFRRRDGSLMEATLHFCRRRNLSTGAPYLVGFVWDVTGERESRRTLLRTTRLLEEAERLAHLGSWQWDVGRDRFRFSREWLRLHDARHETMSSSEALLLVHADDRPTVEAVFREAATKGTSVNLQYRTARCPDGRSRHVQMLAEPLRDDDGSTVALCGSTLDITERVEAHAAVRERERSLTRALDGTVTALVRTVEIRDPYTAGHQQRVARLAVTLARSLGWSDDQIGDLRLAALLHDIGKIIVPADILSKPTRLERREFELIKAHAEATRDILSSVRFKGPIADIAGQHHERLDGSGYPDGLVADAILPEARVLAVTDVCEAMLSHRPHRPAHPRQTVAEELRGGAGTRYDAVAVAACLDLLEQTDDVFAAED